ncbi:MAG: hypothetical protein GWN78_18985, partial [Gammaproteobacteria bacterium]|nr:hypothetical protein [Gammaproteobacteria bacterium]
MAFVLLLVPATAMGATLPVLVRALSREDPNFGSVLGVLYGWNTLGAVAGVLAGEMLFVRWLGLTGSGLVAAALNLLAAGLALRLAGSKEVNPATVTRPGDLAAGALRSSWPLLLAAFAAGALLLGLEVLWFRFVVLFFNGHSWNFAVMLATVLLGISLGGRARCRALVSQAPSRRLRAGTASRRERRPGRGAVRSARSTDAAVRGDRGLRSADRPRVPVPHAARVTRLRRRLHDAG